MRAADVAGKGRRVWREKKSKRLVRCVQERMKSDDGGAVERKI